jgi:hypothetical protein
MLYAPDSFVIAVVTTPVWVFVAVTVTPGINAFEGSCTNPPTDALPLCPYVFAHNKIMQSSAAAATDNRFIRTSTHGCAFEMAKLKSAALYHAPPVHFIV